MCQDDVQKKGVEFRPDVYMQAAQEHVNSARILHERRDVVLCAYVAGLAAECMFRGFHARIGDEFDSRHDLGKWAVRSGFANRVPNKWQEQYSAALSFLAQFWSNKHRYRSEASLRSHFRKFKSTWKIKGDALKEVAWQSYSSATELVSLGEILWSKDLKKK